MDFQRMERALHREKEPKAFLGDDLNNLFGCGKHSLFVVEVVELASCPFQYAALEPYYCHC